MESARRIHHQPGGGQGFSPGQGVNADIPARYIRAFIEDRYIKLVSQRHQLLNRRRTPVVRRHQQRPLAGMLQVQGQLGGGCGLAAALQPDQHDHERLLAGGVESTRLVAQRGDKFLVDDFDHLLAGGQALHHLRADGPLPHPVDKVLDHLEVNIGLQQGQPHLTQPLVNVLLRQPPLIAQQTKYLT